MYFYFCIIIVVFAKISVTSCFQDKIAGGYKCNVTNYPFIVTLISRGVCGGTLITLEWVLTGAHCLQDSMMGKAKIRAGFNLDPQYVQSIDVKYYARHPKFDLDKFYKAQEIRYDIGMAQTVTPFTPSPVARPAKLPKPGTASKCKIAKVAGIGIVNENEFFQLGLVAERPLLCADLPIIDKEICTKAFDEAVVDDSIICSWAEGKDACQGDSGGPLFCFDDTIIATVAIGPKDCGQSDLPGAYTKIENYLDFIQDQMKIHSKSAKIVPTPTRAQTGSSSNTASRRTFSKLNSVYTILTLLYIPPIKQAFVVV